MSSSTEQDIKQNVEKHKSTTSTAATTSSSEMLNKKDNNKVVEIDSTGKKVFVDGKEVDAGDVHNDGNNMVTNYFSALPGNEEEYEVEETEEECFINDARYGELEDVATTLAGKPHLILCLCF